MSTATPPAPDWWARVARTATCMRVYTGMLLDRATPSIDGATLRLEFHAPEDAANWQASSSSRVLDAALRHHGIHATVDHMTQN